MPLATKEELGTPQTTAPPAHEPQRPSHDCLLTTLPVVTARSGETRSRAGTGQGAQVPAVRPARTPRPGGSEVRAAPRVLGSADSGDDGTGVPATARSGCLKPAHQPLSGHPRKHAHHSPFLGFLGPPASLLGLRRPVPIPARQRRRQSNVGPVRAGDSRVPARLEVAALSGAVAERPRPLHRPGS